jgi:glutamine amidotransferase
MIHIVDYGAGNIGSIANMIKKAGGRSVITHDAQELMCADKIILPGVGHFDSGMRKLRESGLIPILNNKVKEQKCPILGVCLGAQMMTLASEEGNESGLGWFDARVLKFPNQPNFKVPHMGWRNVTIEKETLLSFEMDESFRYYFVHSYYIKANHTNDVLFTAEYGSKFVAGLSHENIFAVQFHPEKSHRYGLKLMQNFIRL